MRSLRQWLCAQHITQLAPILLGPLSINVIKVNTKWSEINYNLDVLCSGNRLQEPLTCTLRHWICCWHEGESMWRDKTAKWNPTFPAQRVGHTLRERDLGNCTLCVVEQLQLWLFVSSSDDCFKESSTVLWKMERQKFSLDNVCIKTHILT